MKKKHDKNNEEEEEERKRWASKALGEIEDFLHNERKFIWLARITLLLALASFVARYITNDNIVLVFLREYIWPITYFFAYATLHVIGFSISLSIAIGCASHIQEVLDNSRVKDEPKEAAVTNSRHRLNNLTSSLLVPALDDTSYTSIMASAGYFIDPSCPVRGQRVPKPENKTYKEGIELMESLFPGLPNPIQKELGIILDFVVRDFVASWFCNMQVKPRCPAGDLPLASTANTRKHPFLTNTTTSIAYFIGRFCSLTSENLNVMEFLLINVVKCLTHSIKTYRKMKKRALNRTPRKAMETLSKHQSFRASQTETLKMHRSRSFSQIPENNSYPEPDNDTLFQVAIVREFLLSDQLHKAMTFGVDLKAMLYNGDDLINQNDLHTIMYKSTLFNESELDYNRVLSHRLCRKLLVQADFNSLALRAFAVESIATSLIIPIMETWTPDFINKSIINVIETQTKQTNGQDDSSNAKLEENEQAPNNEKKQIQSTMKQKSSSSSPKPTTNSDQYKNHEENLEKSPATILEDINDTLTKCRVDTVEEKNVPLSHQTNQQNSSHANEEHLDNNAPVVHSKNLTDSIQVQLELPSSPANTEMSLDQLSIEISGREISHEESDFIEDENDIIDSIDSAKIVEASTEDEVDEEQNDEVEEEPKVDSDLEENTAHILPLLSFALTEMENYLEENQYKNEDGEVNWMNKGVRETVCQLVLVIEAAMCHGRKPPEKEDKTSLSMILMEMTTNVLEFEKKISSLGEAYFEQLSNQKKETYSTAMDESSSQNGDTNDDTIDDSYSSAPSGGMFAEESSTFRTLIAAWLQTGDVYTAIKVFSTSQILLQKFYTEDAFFRNKHRSNIFLLRLKPLEGVSVLVDTMSVLEKEALTPKSILSVVEEKMEKLNSAQKPNLQPPKANNKSKKSNVQITTKGNSTIGMAMKASLFNQKQRLMSRWVGGTAQAGDAPGATNNSGNAIKPAITYSKEVPVSGRKSINSTPIDQTLHHQRNSTPALSSQHLPYYLNFHANIESLSKLRIERDHRNESWNKSNQAASTTADGKYRIIDMIYIPSSRYIHRELHGLARSFTTNSFKLSFQESEDKDNENVYKKKISIELLGGKRVMNIPDDDSGFLVRAQQRMLNPIGVHKDDRNHEKTHRCYLSSFEEQIVVPSTGDRNRGRYIHYCALKYYPSDRTVTVATLDNDRFISKNFHKKRETTQILPNKRILCQKVSQRHASGSLVPNNVLVSNVMDLNDFCAIPRAGKALDFIYRMPLYEYPLIELNSYRFTIHDGVRKGPHRADASSLELSDASLSVALLLKSHTNTIDEVNEDGDSTPLVYMKKMQRGDSESNSGKGPTVIGYRPSYIRAALLIASAKQDAQLQVLTWCVRAGSARKATKARIEAVLQPALSLLDFASSKNREKEAILLRDLRIGVNYIDPEHFRKNGVLNPRSPTMLRGLNAKVDSWIQSQNSDSSLSVSFKIRCVALSEIAFFHDDANNVSIDLIKNPGPLSGNMERKVYRLEWTLMRSFRDFLSFHNHLKSQVSSQESSGTGPRFFNQGVVGQRQGLVPSLATAKGNSLVGSTQRALEKRKEALNDYLNQLLAKNNFLSKCPELMRFLGADKPFLPEIEGRNDFVRIESDNYGRINIKVTRINADNIPEILSSSKPTTVTVANLSSNRNNSSRPEEAKTEVDKERNPKTEAQSMAVVKEDVKSDKEIVSTVKQTATSNVIEKDRMRKAQIAAVKARIDRIRLSQVRNAAFDFVRCLFDLDSYVFRSRLMSAVRTMSFVVANSQDFSQILLENHLSYVNGESISEMLRTVRETIWPNGVFSSGTTPCSVEESNELRKRSMEALSSIFPDQLKRLLGQELTDEGLTLLHEMLQNKVLVKHLGYMIVDIMLLSIFPDFNDFLDGTSIIESNE